MVVTNVSGHFRVSSESGKPDEVVDGESGLTRHGWQGVAKRVGLVIMVSSLPLWLVLPVLPFLPMTLELKATVAGGVVVVAEVMFWTGAVLAGPTVVRRLRAWLGFAGRDPEQQS